LKDPKHPATAGPCNTGPAQISGPVVHSAALAPHGNSCPQNVDESELLSTAQLFGSSSAPGPPATSPSMFQPERAPNMGVRVSAPTGVIPDSGFMTDSPEWWKMMDGFTGAPETKPPTAELPTAEPQFEPRQPSERMMTYEELEAFLQRQDSAVLEQTTEEGPSAASEFHLDLKHSRAVEAGRAEHPFAIPTREDVEGTLCDDPLLSNTNPSTEQTQGEGMSGIWASDFDFGSLLNCWEG